MNRQEIFSKVATHLLKQNKKAMNSVSCAYLAADGSKCAIGALIPDGHAAQSSDAQINNAFFNYYPDLNKLWAIESYDDIYFLRQLQMIHDQYDVINWRGHLEFFARNNNLTMPEEC